MGSIAKPLAQPKLFQPLQIRGLHLRNRIIVSPMGMYSSNDGHLTDFHMMHYGHLAFRGAAMTIVEATAVLQDSRTSMQDNGAWSDDHIPAMKKLTDYIHGIEGGEARIGIQLVHGGRKGGLMPIYPGEPLRKATKEDGWDYPVWGPSPIPFSESHIVPKEMPVEEIKRVVVAYGDAAARCVKGGFDAIDIHAAHGYLLSSFLTPGANQRTDEYGGSFENRIRILVEVVKQVKLNIPDSIPLFVRISSTDWMEHSPSTPQWTIDDSKKLALILADLGVDVLDVSSGGNMVEQRVPYQDTYYQISLAEQIRNELRANGKDMLVTAVGKIDNATLAEEVVTERADLAMAATVFLRDPNCVLKWAEELGADFKWPRQYLRGTVPKK